MAWLWLAEREPPCRLLVISTPYVEGRHYATLPGDFVPLVGHLQRLHARGYVHGDIRCFNAAMGPSGGLFDFDLGGKVRIGRGMEALKYPDGYNDSVPDGTRLGLAREPITKLDDVVALTGVIFTFHHFLPPGSNNEAPPAEEPLSNEPSSEAAAERGAFPPDLRALLVKLEGFWAGKERPNHTDPEIERSIHSHMEDLTSFLVGADKHRWTVLPKPAFRRQLEKYGFIMATKEGQSAPRGEGEGGETALLPDVHTW
jgi:hypothetical protein